MSIDSLSSSEGKWKLTTSEGRKIVSYSDDLKNKIEFFAHKIRKVSHKEHKGYKIKKDILRLNVEDENGNIVRVGIKIKDLNNFLGAQPKDLIKKRQFEDAIKSKLQEKVAGDTTESSSNLETEEVPLSSVEEIIISSEDEEKSEEELFSHKALNLLSQYGLSKPQCETLSQFYTYNQKKIEALKEATLIRKDLVYPPLPRSLVYIPEGPKKGLHILLKAHGIDKEVGVGSFNRVTLTVHAETGAINVLRNARKEDLGQYELEAYKLTASRPDKFATGIPINYKGSWRDRTTRKKDEDKSNIPKIQNVEKVGFLMDFIEGGELVDRLDTGPPLSMKERRRIAWEYAEALAVLHEMKLVHLDQKLQNTFLTKDGHPKIGDFGFTLKRGTLLLDKENKPKIVGTQGMIAPEIVKGLLETSPYRAEYPADIWSMGCLLSDLFDTSWIDESGQYDDDWLKILDENRVNEIKEEVFANKDDPQDHEWVIDKCLEFDPNKRPTARQVADWLKKLL